MKKLPIILISLSMLILACSLGFLSCQPVGKGVGSLQGAVTIGPITPVEQPGQCPPVSAEVFSSRKIMIYDESGTRLLNQVDIRQIGQSANGYYIVLLAPGTYTVDINYVGIDHADGLPMKITINVDVMLIFDVNIDTGIR
jgi:hypothetical protein